MSPRTKQRVMAAIAAKAVVLAMGMPASATIIPLTDFVSRFGSANQDQFTTTPTPTSSGQNAGFTAITRSLPTTGSFEGRAHQNLVITDTTAVLGSTAGAPAGFSSAFSFRYFITQSGAGNAQDGDESGLTPPNLFPAPVFGNTGFAGYYMRTSTPGLFTTIALDEGIGSTATERGVLKPVIADGRWHLYEWNLGNTADWDAQFGASNGQINSAAPVLDAIWLWRDVAFNSNGTTPQVSTVDFDFIGYNPAGSFQPIRGFFNTGLNEAGTPATPYTGDAHWFVHRVAAADSPLSLEDGVAGAVVNQDGNPIGPWAANNATSGWIASQYTVNFDDAAGFYDYSMEFVVPDGTIMQLIQGRWMVDDDGATAEGINIFINGVATGQTANSQTAFTNFTINSGFVTGVNRLTFRTQNIGVTDSGIRVEFTNIVSVIVPEPASLTLAAAGLFALARRRNRREA